MLSPPRLRIIGRTIIWLFDEESSDVKGLLFKSLQVWGDRTIIWLFDEESVGIIIVDRVYPINVKPALSPISYVIYQALKLSLKRK